jgi:hypothetical protein
VFVSSKEVFGLVSGHLTAAVELILEEDVIFPFMPSLYAIDSAETNGAQRIALFPPLIRGSGPGQHFLSAEGFDVYF